VQLAQFSTLSQRMEPTILNVVMLKRLIGINII